MGIIGGISATISVDGLTAKAEFGRAVNCVVLR